MVTPRPFIRSATARKMKRLRDREFATDALFFDDAWTLWRTLRPTSSWDTGASAETATFLGEGVGTLYEQGVGGPQDFDGVVHVESPYRLETWATVTAFLGGSGVPDSTGAFLVINGTRRFAVDLIKVSDIDDRFAALYLTEQINMPIPVVEVP